MKNKKVTMRRPVVAKSNVHCCCHCCWSVNILEYDARVWLCHRGLNWIIVATHRCASNKLTVFNAVYISYIFQANLRHRARARLCVCVHLCVFVAIYHISRPNED